MPQFATIVDMRRRYITLEGLFENDVLGIFKIIRGFANLKDLATISVAYEMQVGAEQQRVQGFQRQIDLQHAKGIKEYLEKSDNRFIPEVILSIRTDLQPEFDEQSTQVGVQSNGTDGISIKRRWKSKNVRIHRIKIDRRVLHQINLDKRIRRIDGNHRLALADQLVDNLQVPNKYLAPFCMILLNSPGNGADDYSESLIFHTINSTALPLESEHALALILGQDTSHAMTTDTEFSYSPILHLTRLLRDGVQGLPRPAQDRLGSNPLTSLGTAARGMLEMDPAIANDRLTLQTFADDLFAALNDILTRLSANQPELCNAEFFLELAARIWKEATGSTHDERVNASIAKLEKLAVWLGRDGLVNLKGSKSLSKQILEIYGTVQNRVPKKVFLARWYPTAENGSDYHNAKLRFDHIKDTLEEIEREKNIHLGLIDMGTQTGGTFPIHHEMYNAIASSDIILIDLTGLRPNVCIEAGYALKHHEKERLIFIFQNIEGQQNFPFDLNTYRYETFRDTGEIKNKVKPHIEAIISNANVGIP
jgi:hypothetical protein